VLIDYGIMRASTSNDEYRQYQNLKPGIDSKLGGVCTLGALKHVSAKAIDRSDTQK
jgi:hypothetical protein